MAVFKYRLQNVLDIKFRLEDQAKVAFATAMARQNEEEDKLKALVRRKEGYEEAGRKMREDVLNMIDMRDNDRAIDIIKERIEQQTIELDKAKAQVDIARRNLNDAMQERKIHEKLKENNFEKFRQEVNATESREVDELVSYTYGERIKKAGEEDTDKRNDNG